MTTITSEHILAVENHPQIISLKENIQRDLLRPLSNNKIQTIWQDESCTKLKPLVVDTILFAYDFCMAVAPYFMHQKQQNTTYLTSPLMTPLSYAKLGLLYVSAEAGGAVRFHREILEKMVRLLDQAHTYDQFKCRHWNPNMEEHALTQFYKKAKALIPTLPKDASVKSASEDQFHDMVYIDEIYSLLPSALPADIHAKEFACCVNLFVEEFLRNRTPHPDSTKIANLLFIMENGEVSAERIKNTLAVKNLHPHIQSLSKDLPEEILGVSVPSHLSSRLNAYVQVNDIYRAQYGWCLEPKQAQKAVENLKARRAPQVRGIPVQIIQQVEQRELILTELSPGNPFPVALVLKEDGTIEAMITDPNTTATQLWQALGKEFDNA